MKQEKKYGFTGVVLLIIAAFMVATCGTAHSQPAYQDHLEQKRSELGGVNRSIHDLEVQIKDLQQDLTDIAMMQQIYENDPIAMDSSDYNRRCFDEKLKEYPLLVSGGEVEINDLKGFMSYWNFVTDKLTYSVNAGITLETLQRDLEYNKAFRDKLQEEIATLEGAHAPQPIQPISYPLEGRWLCPDMILIDVQYLPEHGYYVGEIIEHNLKFFSHSQNRVLFLVSPLNENPNVYQGKEFGYNDAGGDLESPLVLSVSENTMTYRNPDQTLTFIRQ
jgi:hypothetical protein